VCAQQGAGSAQVIRDAGVGDERAQALAAGDLARPFQLVERPAHADAADLRDLGQFGGRGQPVAGFELAFGHDGEDQVVDMLIAQLALQL